jgi:hypothetical protein
LKRKPGRPARDLKSTCEVFLSSFYEADKCDPKFFGAECSACVRNTKTLLKDVETKLKSAKDEEKTNLEALRKGVDAVKTIMELIQTEGWDSSRFGPVFDSQVHFLNLAPQLDVQIWPQHMVRHRHNLHIRDLTEPTVFWKAISLTNLKAKNFSADEMFECQAQFVREKLVACVKAATAQDWQS